MHYSVPLVCSSLIIVVYCLGWRLEGRGSKLESRVWRLVARDSVGSRSHARGSSLKVLCALFLFLLCFRTLFFFCALALLLPFLVDCSPAFLLFYSCALILLYYLSAQLSCSLTPLLFALSYSLELLLFCSLAFMLLSALLLRGSFTLLLLVSLFFRVLALLFEGFGFSFHSQLLCRTLRVFISFCLPFSLSLCLSLSICLCV